MRRDPRAYLWDICNSAEAIFSFCAERTFDDYQENAMLRSAVERQFEIIGEALNQLSKTSPDIVERIPDYKEIISFRNVLIHGYAAIDNATAWNAVKFDLLGLYTAAKLIIDDPRI
jgi:uncharacterized protein with HEPN domain